MNFLRQFVRYGRTFAHYARWQLVVLIAATFAAVITETLGITMLLPLLKVQRGGAPDDAITNHTFALIESLGFTPGLGSVLSLIVVLFMLKGVFMFAHTALAVQVKVGVRRDLQIWVSSLVTNMSYRYYTQTSSGHLSTIMVREVDRFVGALAKYVQVLVNVVYVGIYLTTATMMKPSFTLIAILAGGVLIYLLRGLVEKTRRYSVLLSEVFTNSQSLLIQLVQTFTFLKATATVPYFARRMNEEFRRLARIERWQGLLAAALKAMNEPIAVAALALIVFYQVSIQGDPLDAIIVVGVLFYRMLSQILSLQVQWQQFNQSVGGVDAVEAAVQELSAKQEAGGRKDGGARAEGDIEFDGVSIYHGEFAALRDVSLTIPRCQTVGIVGESGAGKTTFFHLLTSMLPPDEGSVRIGGTDYREIDRDWFRSRTGYVTQEPAIFDDTIGNNIAMWRCDPADPHCAARVHRAAELAGCDDFAQDLNRRIGEKGIQLSGGQRQRIAIARELFKEPALLIFDEATSALDSRSEMLIRDSIERMHGERTVVIISHRLSTVRDCDVIFVFEKGRVIERGSFDELYDRPGSTFRNLCDKQSLTR